MRVGSRLLLFAVFAAAQPLSAQAGLSSGGHIVSGYVREEGTGATLSAVTLELYSSGQRAAPSAFSGMDGQFRFASVRDGDYYIVARKEGYIETTTRISVSPSGIQSVLVNLPKVHSEHSPNTADPISTRQLSIPEKARDAFEKGRKLLYEKSAPEKALNEFQRAVAEFPSYFEAYTQIGVADYHLKKFPEAEDALRKAIELSENKYPESLYLLAGLLNDEQRFMEAEPVARRATLLDDSSWHSYFEMARSLVGQKRGNDAAASALKARELNPDYPEITLTLANAHILQQDYPAVLLDFDAYLKIAPKGPASESVRQRRDRLQKTLSGQPARSN